MASAKTLLQLPARMASSPKRRFSTPLPASSAGNTALAGLEKRRITLEAEIEQLKAKKGDMPAGQYEEELERLAIELAKVSAQIRTSK